MNRDSLHAVIFSLTESEAKNFGSFLCLCLQKLTHWHSRKSVYESSALAPGRPGFLVKFPDEPVSADDMKAMKMFDYEDFRAAMHKWHLKMRKCFLQCLSSGDYMQLRNGMIVLNKISEFFPLIDYMGKELESSVSKIEKREDRADVKQMARSYYANLRRRKSHWIPTSKFCNQPKPVIPPEDEIAESVESSSVADMTEDPNEGVEDYQMESGEVKGIGSEMDVDEAALNDLQTGADGVPEDGTEVLEVEEPAGGRIISVVSNTGSSSNIVANDGSEEVKTTSVMEISTSESVQVDTRNDRRGVEEEKDGVPRIAAKSLNSREPTKSKEPVRSREDTISSTPSKLERSDSRRSDRERNSRTDNARDSRDSRDKQGNADSGNRNGRDRDDRVWRESDSGRPDRNSRGKDEIASRDNRDSRRNPDDRNPGRRDDRNQRRDDRDPTTAAPRDSKNADGSRVRRRDDAKDSHKQQESRSPTRGGRGSEENGAGRPTPGNKDDRNNRDRSNSNYGQTALAADNRTTSSSRRNDDRSSSRRSADERPQRDWDQSRQSVNPALDSISSSRDRDIRDRSGDRDSSARPSHETISSQEQKQPPPSTTGDSNDADRAKQFSKEEKDRMLLARIDKEKKSLEQNKQAAQLQSDTGKSDLQHSSNNSRDDDGRETRHSSAKDESAPAQNSDFKNEVGESRTQSQSRPRFERPQRSNSRNTPTSSSTDPSVTHQQHQPDRYNKETDTLPSFTPPSAENRDTTNNRNAVKEVAEPDISNYQRPDSGNGGKRVEIPRRDAPPPHRDFRHPDRRGGGPEDSNNHNNNYNDRGGGAGNRSNRGDDNRRGSGGDRGNRGGGDRGGGQQGRNYDNNRGRGGHSQQRSDGRQQYNQQDRDRGRDDSKRPSDGGRNRFMIYVLC